MSSVITGTLSLGDGLQSQEDVAASREIFIKREEDLAEYIKLLEIYSEWVKPIPLLNTTDKSPSGQSSGSQAPSKLGKSTEPVIFSPINTQNSTQGVTSKQLKHRQKKRENRCVIL